jgi:serine/threonine-protein kinase
MAVRPGDVDRGSSSWARIKEVFAACYELPSDERARALRALCAGDQQLGREVQSLIAAYEASGSFLDHPPIRAGQAITPGTRLGPYEVIERVGAGGMGEVYRARDTRLNRSVAVKILPPAAARQTGAREQLEREARTISSLNHPNICALFDVGREGEVDYLVMEFLEGETLTSRLARGPLPPDELVRTGIEIADALDRAHRQGVIHCDLKPSNIVLTESGAKLLDFGIARFQDAADAAQHGTLAYTAPEVLRGERPDARADIFAFGATLYEMATGRPAFAGDRDAVRQAIAAGPPAGMIQRNRRGDRRLAAIVDRALQPARERRYQRISEIRRALEAASRPPVLTTWMVAAAAVAIVVAGLAALFWRAPQAPPTPALRSVAVLPFKPLAAGGSDDDYIGVAIADALITEFGTIEALAVRPLSASSRYGTPGVDAVAAGRALDAELLVDGAIQRSGDRLRVSVHLINVADGRTIWSDRFESLWSDVFAVQDLIADQVTRALAVTLSGEERRRVQRRRPASVEAYEAYLKGRYFWNMRTAAGLTRALGYFQEALGLDPNYASAHAGLADTYAVLGSTAIAALPPRDAGPKAIAAAARALELDASLAEAHVSFAFAVYSYQWDWARGEEHFRRAIALDADYATAHYWYSLYLDQLGRLDETAVEAQRAVDLEPLSQIGTYAIGLTHYCARRFDRAREYALRVLEVDPGYPLGLRLLGSSLVAEGRYADAVAPYERLARGAPDNSLYAGWLAHVYGRVGNADAARAILSQLTSRPNARQLAAANIAIGYIGLGDHDSALTWLESAYAEHSQALTYLKIDPVYDPLRSDRRFADLLQRVGLSR